MTTTLRAPGIYKAPDEARYVQLELGVTGVPGFIGMTQRGPTNMPVRVSSEEQFEQVFGLLEEGGYLRDAVRGFFANGGKYCYVLRVAHMVRRLREETARMASLKLKDGEGRNTLSVFAANEGMWGNEIKLTVKRQKPRVSTFLTLDLAEGDTSAVIKSTHGLSRGTIVRIYDGEKETFRTITDLSGKTIVWEANQPLDRAYRSGAPTYVEPVEFSVEARWKDQAELFQNLSLSPNSDQYVERVINNGSTLIRVEDNRSTTALPESLPVLLEEKLLEGGTDGLFTVTPEDFIGANIGPDERYGLAAFEALDDVDLLVAPDLMWTLHKSAGFRTEKDVEVVQQAMVHQCERLKTRFAILDFPDPTDHRRASQWRLLFDSAYAAFYFPWIQVDTADGVKRLVPPSGHVAGVYSKCDREMGVYRAPANEELVGVVDLARNLFDTDIGQLNSEGINCLKSFPRRGIRVWGARTVSNDTQWRFVNVRRVVNAVIASVEQGLQWAVFEANTPILWKTLERQISGFLRDLWNKGFFRGDTPEDSFYVKCDDETNPKEVRDAGMVVIECGVAPVRPAEYLVFRVQAEVPQASQAGE
ncbi:MAG TPA: phage tail sheath subtilisin-like domain-containing protein [Myxococcota bacterium]|nr:phage tail sheath subtilisin-like domain-containing protein [Myxococcota bacterium]